MNILFVIGGVSCITVAGCIYFAAKYLKKHYRKVKSTKNFKELRL